MRNVRPHNLVLHADAQGMGGIRHWSSFEISSRQELSRRGVREWSDGTVYVPRNQIRLRMAGIGPTIRVRSHLLPRFFWKTDRHDK